MIITISGNPGGGKTALAKDICNGKKSSFIEQDSLKAPFWAAKIDHDIDFIVIDDVTNCQEIYATFNNERLTINRRGEESVEIMMPNVILILK